MPQVLYVGIQVQASKWKYEVGKVTATVADVSMERIGIGWVASLPDLNRLLEAQSTRKRPQTEG